MPGTNFFGGSSHDISTVSDESIISYLVFGFSLVISLWDDELKSFGTTLTITFTLYLDLD